jgi:conjugal transfer pilin signal peptidase TrbI
MPGSGIRLIVLGTALAVLLAGRAAADLEDRWRFSVNLTESLPNWAFIIDLHDRTPTRGELVAFAPPPNRWFDQGAVFAKRVAGVPGDTVVRRGGRFWINGRYVGAAKPRDRGGRAVKPSGEGVLPAGRYFVVTDHPDSLDSRYEAIGWIDQGRILGVARPVL